MSKIDKLFASLMQSNKKALMPFITAGDPDLEFTSQILQRLSSCGAHLCELGIPYSDPIADGPTIQASYTRALDAGLRVGDIFEMTKRLQTKIETPLVSMVSYAIILRQGIETYVQTAIESGISGAIVPDLPLEEADVFRKLCTNNDFSLIQLVAPTTPRERALRIAETSTGFLYYISVTGITGERAALPAELEDNVSWLRERTPLPICIGFGISGPEQVRKLAPIADGLIVGSAFVRRIANPEKKPQSEVLDDVEQFTKSLLAAM